MSRRCQLWAHKGRFNSKLVIFSPETLTSIAVQYLVPLLVQTWKLSPLSRTGQSTKAKSLDTALGARLIGSEIVMKDSGCMISEADKAR